MQTSSYVSLNPTEISQGDMYKLLIGSVVPRPIAFVSTQSTEGNNNLAPFSFFNAVASNPPALMFSMARRGSDGAKKDTLINLENTGECVVNIVSEDIVQAMNQTSAEYPPEVSEFKAAGLTPVPSLSVKPPRVGESLVQMECRVLNLVPVGDGSIGSACVAIVEVVQFHCAAHAYQNGRILIEALKPVARLAGSSYCPVREIFEIARPVI
ncbi:MAG: flavin reductase family protein [Cyanobacteria bacterium]|nr:flavin reductase family protein [Cyanobacteriota bacterium]